MGLMEQNFKTEFILKLLIWRFIWFLNQIYTPFCSRVILSHVQFIRDSTVSLQRATIFFLSFCFQTISDWKLALGVLILVVIDVVILVTYTTVIEASNGGRESRAQRILNREDPTLSEPVCGGNNCSQPVINTLE